MFFYGFAIAAVVCSVALAEERPAAADVINGLKEYQRSLGLSETGNFRRHSDKPVVSYRCYYTGKLELPLSYDELKLREGTATGCPLDEQKYDVFFYPVEAVASGGTPVTSTLAKAPVERVLMVVPHEDLHDSKELEKLGTGISEAAATLLGFRTAAAFARQRFGVSTTYDNLSREAELFLAKARIVNSYWDSLTALYADVRAARARPEDALAIKEQSFAKLRDECGAIRPRPATFDPCPAANNNAGLAFDATYTRYYPLIYELYQVQGENFQSTLSTLAQLGGGKRISEQEAAELLTATIERLRSKRTEPKPPEAGDNGHQTSQPQM